MNLNEDLNRTRLAQAKDMKSIIFVSLSIFLITNNAKASKQTYVLSPGRILELQTNSHSIYNSNPKVAKIRKLNQKTIVTAKSKGITNILLSEKTVEIKVVDSETYDSFIALKRITKNMKGLEVGAENNLAYVKGELLRVSDWQAISAQMGRSHKWAMRAKVPIHMQSKTKKWLSTKLTLLKVHGAAVNFLPEPILEIPSHNPLNKNENQVGLQELGLEVKNHSQAVMTLPMVNLLITVSEVRRHSLQRLGIRWPSSIEAQLLPTPTSDPAQTKIALEALEQNGDAKILASPRLLCRTNESCQFLAGGEIPIKILGFGKQDVIWKKYGIVLSFKPQTDITGRMSISLTTEVSSIDPSTTVDGVPGFLTNRIESHFDMEKSGTIALSGLIKHEDGKNAEGLPGLLKIPILGSLFGSKEFREKQTELIIFVTPQSIRPSDLDDSLSNLRHEGALYEPTGR